MSDRLANLHQLLRSITFRRWPLLVTFYAQDVFRMWQKSAALQLQALPPRIEVKLDEPPQRADDSIAESDDAIGIRGIDVTYKGLKSHLVRSEAGLAMSMPCSFCRMPLSSRDRMTLFCPENDCNGAGHLRCFADAFLKGTTDALVPVDGNCPACATNIHWVDLVREMTLRARAPNDVARITRGKKVGSCKRMAQTASALDLVDDSGVDDDQDMPEDTPMSDDWNYVSDSSASDLDDRLLRGNAVPKFKLLHRSTQSAARPAEPVIEDSDWDEAEVVT